MPRARSRWPGSTAVLLLAAALAAGCVRKPPAPPEFQVNVVRRISNAEVSARRAAGEPVVLLDVRERVVGQPMIKDAVHVPLTRLGIWAKEQPKGIFVVAYCACLHEASAAHTVLELQRDGFTNAWALLDGYQGWAKAGLPVEMRR